MKTRLLQVLWVTFVICVFVVLGMLFNIALFHTPIGGLSIYIGVLGGILGFAVINVIIFVISCIIDYIRYGNVTELNCMYVWYVMYCLPLYLEERKNK